MMTQFTDAYMCPQASMGWLIEAEWHIYISVGKIIIGSNSGLSPIQHQAIIWTNDILSINP